MEREEIMNQIIIHLSQHFKSLERSFDKMDRRNKYLKRVRNREKLYERRKAKYGKK